MVIVFQSSVAPQLCAVVSFAVCASDRVRLDGLRPADEEAGADRTGPAGEEPLAVRPPAPRHALPADAPAAQVHRRAPRRALHREGTSLGASSPALPSRPLSYTRRRYVSSPDSPRAHRIVARRRLTLSLIP